LCGQLPAECVGLDVVAERALAADLDDREPLAIAGLQGRITVDRDLDQLEVELSLQLTLELLERRPRTLAEVAAGRGVEPDFDYG
jgi:hypothetical protein